MSHYFWYFFFFGGGSWDSNDWKGLEWSLKEIPTHKRDSIIWRQDGDTMVAYLFSCHSRTCVWHLGRSTQEPLQGTQWQSRREICFLAMNCSAKYLLLSMEKKRNGTRMALLIVIFFNIRTLYNTLPPSKDFIQFLPAASVSSGRANTSKLRPALTEWQEDMQNHHTCDVHETATHRFKATQLFVDVLPQKWLLKKSGRIHSESSPTIRTWHVHHNLSMKWSIQVPNDMSGDKWRKLLGGLLAWEVVSGNFPLSF